MAGIIMPESPHYFQHISGWISKQVIDPVFYDGVFDIDCYLKGIGKG
ncbi:MAG: hypothetical protein JW762_04545 [Dehalococcoidales bacterium]|nr:hypothetical protein [Dehalococcoidales bacterium]